MTFQQNVRKPFLNYVLLDRYFALEVFFFPEIELLAVFFPGQFRPGNRTGAHSRVQRIPMAYEPLKKKKKPYSCAEFSLFGLRIRRFAIRRTGCPFARRKYKYSAHWSDFEKKTDVRPARVSSVRARSIEIRPITDMLALRNVTINDEASKTTCRVMQSLYVHVHTYIYIYMNIYRSRLRAVGRKIHITLVSSWNATLTIARSLILSRRMQPLNLYRDTYTYTYSCTLRVRVQQSQTI